MAWTCDVSIEEKVRQDCYNRGYEQGRKNPAEEFWVGVEKLQKQVKEYQDKIENGTLVEVPYKFGSTLYFIVININGGELSIFETDLWVYYSMFVANEKGEIVMGLGIDINDTSFDEETFVMVKEYATREEAEKKLQELQE